MVEKLEQNEDLTSNLSLPRAYHLSVTIMEVIFVIILAIICSKIFLKAIDTPTLINYQTSKIAADLPKENSLSESQAFTFLKTTDPFFGALQIAQNDGANNIPESTLEVKIFGLRADGAGGGTVILKTQGQLQKLVKIGDEFAPGVKLTAVHSNRIDFRRNGILETVYLIKERRNTGQTTTTTQTSSLANSNPAASNAGHKNIEQMIDAMDLTPLRSGPQNRISGFVVGQEGQAAILAIAGLKTGDIINSVNGRQIHSWERVREIPEEAVSRNSGNLNIQIERNGEILSLAVSQSSLGQ